VVHPSGQGCSSVIRPAEALAPNFSSVLQRPPAAETKGFVANKAAALDQALVADVGNI